MGRALGLAILLLVPASTAWAEPALPNISLSFGEAKGPEQVVPALKVLLLFTVLTLAPAFLITMTSFTRILVVLAFVRQALGVQGVPPMQLVTALALMLTAVVMAPVAKELETRALDPYVEKKVDERQAFTEASAVIRTFLLRHTREKDLLLFYEITQSERPKVEGDIALHLLIPAFVISELRTGFEMGFLVFLPFVLVDLIVASLLTSMGMVMLPPTMVSTPLKLLLFVVVDGWALLTRSLVSSFG